MDQTPRRKPKIAHLAGPNATIQNSPPLVTSNKARAKYGLPPRLDSEGGTLRFDVLRPQRLAAPATVYVEQFSAHPLEADAAALYAPPDGYLDAAGVFHQERQSESDVPVYEVTLLPEDGLYPLPYMARQADGRAWEGDCTDPDAPAERARQPFYPDGSRSFEEIDRFGIGEEGVGNLISSRADVDFYRIIPPSGYTKGLPAARRTDVGSGDIPPEVRGRDFFPYRPTHLAASPPRPLLAQLTNRVQRIMASGEYLGAIFTQGSPRVEESSYWMNLLIDTTMPIVGNAAQRAHGQISNDGPKNLVDSVGYITSRVWADADGRDKMGVVVIQDEQIFTAREVQKADARPGGYVATGGHGGIVGNIRHDAPPVLTFQPLRRHTYCSAVKLTSLPRSVQGVQRVGGRLTAVDVAVKDAAGDLLPTAIPLVAIVKDGSYLTTEDGEAAERQVDIVAWIERALTEAPLAGFVVEGQSPYGTVTSNARNAAMLRAATHGLPVVVVGRGNHEGFASPRDRVIAGSNLTATKARLLLMACLLKLGSLPPAADPDHPTDAELAAIRAKIGEYQEIFDTH